MQHLYTILALVAAVSAIDIQGHTESHCGGSTVTFVNANPGRCYAPGGVCWAYSFTAIPRGWILSTRSHKGGNCKELVHTFNLDGRDWVCHGADVNNLEYTGAGYSFINEKRSEDFAFDSEGCEKPGLLTLKDGPTYNISGTDDEIMKNMVKSLYVNFCQMLIVLQIDYAWNGTATADMPSEFDKYITQ